MTNETRTLIDFKDIVALEYECTNCGTKTSFLIGKIYRHPMTCRNCNQEWFLTETDHNRAAICNLANWLTSAIQAMEALQSNGAKLRTRLEVSIHKGSVPGE